MVVVNRANFTNAPRQDVSAAYSAAGCSNWTTRFAVSVAFPTTARAWLRVDADSGSGLHTYRYLMAERVVRATNQWMRVTGTRRVGFPGVISNAVFYTEVGMSQEPAQGDSNGDGFSNREEFFGNSQPTNSASFPGSRFSARGIRFQLTGARRTSTQLCTTNTLRN